MVDQRELTRFAVEPPAKGTLRIASDVLIRHAGNEWIALGPEPCVEGEIVQLDFGSAESLLAFSVTVLESQPIVVGLSVRNQLRLGMVASSRREESQSGWATGVLTRDLDVRLLNFSGSGCEVESDRPLHPGRVAHLRVSLGGIDFGDEVEIVRCRAAQSGGSACLLGARFCVPTPVDELSHQPLQAQGLAELIRSLNTARVQ